MKSSIAVILFTTLNLLCNSAQSQTEVQTDSLFKELSWLFWTNSGRAFLDESDQSPQHFLFSIRFELDSNGKITDIKNSTNMHWVFEGTVNAIREKIDTNMFVRAGYKNTQIIVPVFVFIIQLDKPISYGNTLERINEIWNYGPDNLVAPHAVFFPPIHRFTSKAAVTFSDVEGEGYHTKNKLMKNLPHDKKKN